MEIGLVDGAFYCGKHAKELTLLGYQVTLTKFDAELECQMCQTKAIEGNRCHRDECGRNLHPQWPAVYCSHKCAVEDA